jgi:ATP-dependent protease ClpP protease subunit
MVLQLSLVGPVGPDMVRPLIELVTDGVKQGAKEVRIGMSSPGGSVFQGVTAHNLLRGLDIPVHTHNLGQVDSITAVIYCAGTTRSCVPNARFMLHGLSTTFKGDTKIEEKQLRERLSKMENDRKNIAGIIARATGQSAGRIETDMLEGLIISAEEALEYGFVSEISDHFYDFDHEIHTIQTS